MISSGVFFIFLKLSFFGLLGGWKKKVQPKMKNSNHTHHVPYLRNSIAYDHDFWYTCVKCDISSSFFLYFHFSGWYLLNGPRWQKKLCLLYFISQEPYIIVIYVHLCTMMISLGVFFFIFSKFWFSGLLNSGGCKMIQNEKKICLLCFTSQESYIYDFHLWYSCVKW